MRGGLGVDQRPQCLGAHEGNVAVEDEDIAFEIGERALSAEDGVGGSELFGLKRELDVGRPRRQCPEKSRLDLTGAMPGHRDDAFGAGLKGALQWIAAHGASEQGVGDLGQGALHARSLTCAQHDGRERRCRIDRVRGRRSHGGCRSKKNGVRLLGSGGGAPGCSP